jgi:hypothetical protein
MTLTSPQIATFRNFWLRDFYAAGPPVSYGSSYNLVSRSTYYTDPDVQELCDMVVLEHPKLVAPYTTTVGDTVAAQAVDPTTALFRLMRVIAFEEMLRDHEWITPMYNAGASDEVVKNVIKAMNDTISRDTRYATNNTSFPGSVDIERK